VSFFYSKIVKMIRQIKQVTKLLNAALLILIMFSCGKDIDHDTFDEQVNLLETFDQPVELSSPEVLSQTPPEEDPNQPAYECYKTQYKAAPGFDELLALDPSSDVIFPGAMLEGNSIPTGEYIPINVDRAPITLSISLQNLSGSPIIEIQDPKLSTVREGIKSILDQDVVSATPAKINFEITEVYSQEHLSIALGANYRAAGNSVQSSFDFNSSQYNNKFVLKYLQVYYTIDMDSPTNPSDLFKNIPDVSELGATAPVYVSSIAYGRMVLYTIETNRSKSEVNAAFNATFNSGGADVEGSYKSVIEESNIKALVIGGSGASASQSIQGPNQVYNYITEGGDYSKDSPGAPLSYKLRFIKKGTPVARVVLSSEYNVRTCEFVSPTYKMKINYVKCIDCPEIGDPEIYGNLTAQAYINNSKFGTAATWNKTSENAVEVKDGKEYPIGTSKNVTLYRPNQESDFIKVSGWIKERDAGDDDDFGADSEDITLKLLKVGVPMNVVLGFEGSVEASFTITRIE
jgi:thiol-activated cytolysin